MTVDISGTRLSWKSIGEWCHVVMVEGDKLRPSGEHYRRLDAL